MRTLPDGDVTLRRAMGGSPTSTNTSAQSGIVIPQPRSPAETAIDEANKATDKFNKAFDEYHQNLSTASSDSQADRVLATKPALDQLAESAIAAQKHANAVSLKQSGLNLLVGVPFPNAGTENLFTSRQADFSRSKANQLTSSFNAALDAFDQHLASAKSDHMMDDVLATKSDVDALGQKALAAQRDADQAIKSNNQINHNSSPIPYAVDGISNFTDFEQTAINTFEPKPSSSVSSQELTRINKDLLGAPVNKPTDHGAIVIYDPNDPHATMSNGGHLGKFLESVFDISETQRLSSLSVGDQATYQQLKQTFKDDPTTNTALKKLLLDGSLQTSKTLESNPRSLIQVLGSGLSQPMRSEVKGVDLTSALIKEMATPQRIGQGYKGTCSVTAAISMRLAAFHPAEYARLAFGLASPNGKVPLASGQILKLPAVGSDAGRSIAQRLMAPALMDLADGRGYTYNDTADKNIPTPTSPLDRRYGVDRRYYGETQKNVAAAMSAVFGTPYNAVADKNPDNILKTIQTSINNGAPVAVGMRFGPDPSNKKFGHEVLVTRITGGWVEYWNPWGQVELMNETEFKKRVNSAAVAKVDANNSNSTQDSGEIKSAMERLPIRG